MSEAWASGRAAGDAAARAAAVRAAAAKGGDGPVGSAPPALVACAHGTADPAGRRAIDALVAGVAGHPALAEQGVRVVAAYVDVQAPSPEAALAALPDGSAVLVPLLLSTGYHVQVDLSRAAESALVPTVVAAALGPDDRLVRLLADRLRDRPGSDLAADDDVRLVAAGSSRARSGADVADMAARLAAQLGRDVRPAYLSAADPLLADVVAANRAAGRRTVGLSYLLAPGFFQDRLQAAGVAIGTDPVLAADGPPPAELVALVLDRYRAGVAALA